MGKRFAGELPGQIGQAVTSNRSGDVAKIDLLQMGISTGGNAAAGPAKPTRRPTVWNPQARYSFHGGGVLLDHFQDHHSIAAALSLHPANEARPHDRPRFDGPPV